MINFLNRFTYVYLVVYTLIFYHFVVALSNRETFHNSKTLSNLDNLDNVALRNLYISKEKKILLDFKYRKSLGRSFFKNPSRQIILIDKECRIAGYKQIDYRQELSSKFSFYLNRKLFYSSIFGSIKLIKI